ncbi:phosphomannomutase/phosphoglucomutase [Candidatus Parcubacteria bacterium]|nr:phosphomannomutase/phosphoglucomutase [Candidatus Parcubacteria bacterium]
MKIDETIFRKYDIRGRYPKEFNEEAAYNIALGFANLFPELKRIVVGGDIRKSTPSLMQVVIKGLIDGGKEVVNAGIVITPVVYFAVCHYNFDGGIVVTASHLGGEFNGIKIVLKNAYPTLPKDYDKIKNLIINNKLLKIKNLNSAIKKIDAEKDYIKYITSKISIKKPLKLIIDSGNGAARLLPEKIFRLLGCEASTIYSEPDDSFPNHIPDPYHKENMEDLKKEVLEKEADLGIAYDGDGDRAGFIDNKGNLINGYDLLMIFTKDAFKKKLGPIVVDSRASMALIEEVKKHKQTIELTVGYHAAVLSKIIEKNAVFGGEVTCHFYFPLEYYLTDDALFASLKLVQIISEKKDFAAYINSLPRYCASEEIFIEFSDTKKYQAVDNFTKMTKAKGLDVNDIDGSRINFENGWGIVRPSNTSAFIKVIFEGRTDKDLLNITRKIINLMDESGIIMPKNQRKKIGL